MMIFMVLMKTIGAQGPPGCRRLPTAWRADPAIPRRLTVFGCRHPATNPRYPVARII
jgi:hypothetical protein